MKLSKKLTAAFFLLTFLSLLLLLLLFLLPVSERLKAQGILPFGGRILAVYYCCDGSVMLTVGPPRPGQFIFRPGVSILHPYFNIYRPGPFVLGTAMPGGACLMVPVCFIPLPVHGTIIRVGTSGL